MKSEYLNIPGVTLVDHDVISYKGKYYDIHEIHYYLIGRFEQSTPSPVSLEEFKKWIPSHKTEFYDAIAVVDNISIERTNEMNIEEKLHNLSESDLFAIVSAYIEDNRYEPIIVNSEASILFPKLPIRKDYNPEDKYASVDGYGYLFSFNDLFERASERELAEYLNSTSKFDYIFEEEGDGSVSTNDSLTLSDNQKSDIKNVKNSLRFNLGINPTPPTLKNFFNDLNSKFGDTDGIKDKKFYRSIQILANNKSAAVDVDEFNDSIKKFKEEYVSSLANKFFPHHNSSKKYSKAKEEILNVLKNGFDKKKIIHIFKKYEDEYEATHVDEDDEFTVKDLKKYIRKITGNAEWREEDKNASDYLKVVEDFENNSLSEVEAKQAVKRIHEGEGYETEESFGSESSEEQFESAIDTLDDLLNIPRGGGIDPIVKKLNSLNFAQDYISSMKEYLMRIYRGKKTFKQFQMALPSFKRILEKKIARKKELEKMGTSEGAKKQPISFEKLLNDVIASAFFNNAIKAYAQKNRKDEAEIKNSFENSKSEKISSIKSILDEILTKDNSKERKAAFESVLKNHKKNVYELISYALIGGKNSLENFKTKMNELVDTGTKIFDSSKIYTTPLALSKMDEDELFESKIFDSLENFLSKKILRDSVSVCVPSGETQVVFEKDNEEVTIMLASEE